MNIKEAVEPHQEFPAKFRAHKQNFVNHCRKYSDSYDEFKESAVHEEAEVQLLMQSMPPMNVGAYNEIIIQFGWLTLFAPAFPAGPLFSFISNMVQVKTEMDSMSMFLRRNNPKGCVDIGLWMDYFELMSFVSIVVSTAIVIFTSKEETLSTWFGDTPYQNLVIMVFIVEHIMIAFKFVLAELIDDVPEWVVEEQRNMKNRVNQVQAEIDNKKLLQKLDMNKGTAPLALVEELILEQHKDRDLACLLIPKLLKGCKEYIKEQEEEFGDFVKDEIKDAFT